MMKKSGFTLIELLVVIAIIAILAAILFPVFMRAKDAGRQASCASNIKQMALACMNYAQDYNDRLPCYAQNYVYTPFPNGDENTIGYWHWMHYLHSYIKNYGVFNCPSTGGTKYNGGFYWPDWENTEKYGGRYRTASYGFNMWLGRAPDVSNPGVPQIISQVKLQTKTPLIADCYYYTIGPTDMNGEYNSAYPTPRHGGDRANMCFIDGHSKTINVKDYIRDTLRPEPGAHVIDPVWRIWDPELQ